MQRIGLYGGSFDPVHLGHLLVAQAAHQEMALDRIFFIPVAQSPFKPDRKLAPDAIRLMLLRLALAGSTYCEVDELELQRGGVSYTIDTVREYQRRFPALELFYLIGADHVPLLPKWREAEALSRLVEFIVIPRPSQAPCPIPAGFRARQLRGFPLGVSSSQIREQTKAGQDISLLTGPAVAEAVRNNGLYL